MSNSIDSAALLSQLREMASQAGIPPAKTEKPEESGTEFTQVLKQSLENVNDRKQSAAKMARAFELGEPGVELSQVMVEMQKARISFETLSQVRKKLVTAYQEIMNMPV
mgnify:CR=1 FL=1